MDLLPALRDAESDLAAWRRSPLRPLIESAFGGVERDDLEQIKAAIEMATARLGELETIEELEETLRGQFAAMSGPKQDIGLRLGFASTDVTHLYRNIRLLIDEGRRTIHDASLGSANIVFLTLKALELRRLMDDRQRDHTLLAIEEPEAHLHPHLQRSVYRHLFEVIGGGEEDSSLSILLPTHSPHIASVAPLRSILLLKDLGTKGTAGSSTAGMSLTDAEEDDLARYLDVTRAEMLFARGIILVEGDAEKFLLPVFAETIDLPLDHLGITVCSVAGVNFQPYAKILTALGIPFAILTDWDPRGDQRPLGYNRALELVEVIEHSRDGGDPEALISELEAIDDYDEFSSRCEASGIFTNDHTLEVDLFNDDDFTPHIIATLREQGFGRKRQARIDAWEAQPLSLDVQKYLSLIEAVGKGRFAQRLASRVANVEPPAYIRAAIEFVASNV